LKRQVVHTRALSLGASIVAAGLVCVAALLGASPAYAASDTSLVDGNAYLVQVDGTISADCEAVEPTGSWNLTIRNADDEPHSVTARVNGHAMSGVGGENVAAGATQAFTGSFVAPTRDWTVTIAVSGADGDLQIISKSFTCGPAWISGGAEFGDPYCVNGEAFAEVEVGASRAGVGAKVGYGIDGSGDFTEVNGTTDWQGHFRVIVPIAAVGTTAVYANFDAGYRYPDGSVQWVYAGDTDYTFPAGCGPTPTAPGAFASLAPSRLLDTRVGTGAPQAPVAASGTVNLQVTGRGGVPASGVSAVVVNVTVTGPAKAGFLTVYPSGTAQPTASNLNFVAGETIPNLVTVKVGTDGKITLTNNSAGTAHLIADVAGYYLAGTPTSPGTFVSLAPSRLLDTRVGNGAPNAPVAANGTVDLQVTGRGGVPASGVAAVVVNVTVTAPTTAGFLTVYPTGTSQPTASNLNFTAGQTIPNLVTVKIGTGGKIKLTNNSAGSVQLIADVAGYYLAGTPTVPGAFVSLDPSRLLDTRVGNGAPNAPVAASGTVDLQVTGRGGVPASGVAAAVVNVTVTGPAAGGFLTVYPSGTAQPTASNLNFSAGQTIPNLVTVKVGTGGKIKLTNNSGGSAQLIGDVAGYFIAGPTG
jgi:hypothetical protein